MYKQLENYPTDIIPIFDLVVTGVYKELYLSNAGQGDMGQGSSEVMPGADPAGMEPII